MKIEPITGGEAAALSVDPVAANIAALQVLFPDAFGEGKIDFDTLRQLLGDAVDDGDEKYGLDWSGKRASRRLALTPSAGTLRPEPDASVDWDTTRNLMIEGDNLEVLKLLGKSYAGKVKLIYIDPPYNTGSDFVYPDDFKDSIGNYLRRTGQVDSEGLKNSSNAESSGRFHTDWLNMIYPRIVKSRELLSDDGIILISIDDDEMPRLRLVADDIFGTENFVAQLFWEKGRKNDARLISSGHDYILIYARNKAHVLSTGTKWREAKPGAAAIQEHYLQLRDQHGSDDRAIESGVVSFYADLPREHPAKKLTRYKNVDRFGVWRDDNMSWPGGGGPRYDVPHPKTEIPCAVPDGGWRYATFEKMKEMISKGKVEFRADHTEPPIRKTYLVQLNESEDEQGDEEGSAIQVAGTYFYRSALQASSLTTSLFGSKVFDFPKDHEVIARWLNYATSGDKNAIIMDFFAGSGTTGHAVMAQNAADGGNRRYILVQLPEPLDPANKDQKTAADFCDLLGKPRTISELTKERLRRAAAKVKAEHPDTKADLGFRAYKLATSNIRAWNPGDDLAGDIEAHISNLLPGRSDADLIAELLLKTGLDLTLPSTVKSIAGKACHAFGGGALMLCFADVSDADATALGDGLADWCKELAPETKTTMFFRDTGFATNQAKLNLAAILEQRLGDRLLKLRSL
jgi:adenine-specific DNA-methyltransferase